MSQSGSYNLLTSPVDVADGGTGATTFTDHGILVGSGTSPITALAAATNGQIPIGSTGADPSVTTLIEGSNITITNGAGTITIAASGSGASTVAFRAKLGQSVSNVTGGGTHYTLICDIEDFDIGSDYNNSTGIFTVPSDGKYQFNGAVRMNNQSGATELDIRVQINSSQFRVSQVNPANVKSGGGLITIAWAYFQQLTASDTVKIVVEADGGSGDFDEIFGATSYETYFSGYLVD